MTDQQRMTEITAGSTDKVASFTSTLALGLRPPRGHAASAAEGIAKKPRVVVTGGSGKLGRAVVRDLTVHGWEVLNFDRIPSPDRESGATHEVTIELTDMGQVFCALQEVDMIYKGVDAVVHLAAICSPLLAPSSTLFQTNVMSTYNVLEACRRLGIKNLVLASSETLIGLPLDPHPPAFLPITEESERRPESAYSLSKLVGEDMAEQYARWDPEMKMISLRYSNVMEPNEYEKFESWQDDAFARSWNAWGYIDVRDGAQAVRLALNSKLKGHHIYLIANSDTCMRMSNEELVQRVFPDAVYHHTKGEHDTLLSIDKARRELLFEPQHSWREWKKKVQS